LNIPDYETNEYFKKSSNKKLSLKEKGRKGGRKKERKKKK